MQVVFLCTQKRDLHLPLVGYLRQLGDLAPDARGLARGARNCTKCNPRRAHRLVQMGVHYRTNGGRPLSTFGGCVSHPRRAHNLVQIIVCYNYHSAELRVSGLPKMAHWYICTFGHWYIWTLVHLYLLFSPIVVQMGDAHYQHLGDALSYKWGTLP